MPKKILFIDDDEGLTDMMRIIFRRKSLEFYTAGDGREGIKMAQDLKPDVIILDIGLPDMKGFEVCKDIKEKKKGEQVPVIFITGQYFSEEDREKGLKLGADDFLIKPFDPNELLTRISSILQRYPSSDEPTQ